MEALLVNVGMSVALLRRHTPESRALNVYISGKLRLCSPLERLKHVRDICELHHNFNEEKHQPMFIVDDEHKLIYCNIPKTGSSTMKILLMTSTRKGREMQIPKSSHQDSDLYSRGLKLKKYSKTYENYTKIMFVRNPYERLISAYKDKFRGKHIPGYFISMKRRILKEFSVDERAYGFNFSQFVNLLKGVYSKKLNKYRYNPHWNNYEHQCTPCLISYDFILRTEAMSEELSKYVLPLINRSSSYLEKQTRQVTTPHNSNIYDKYLKLFEQLTEEQIYFLKKRFSITELMYGYSFEEKSLVSSCEISMTDDRCC